MAIICPNCESTKTFRNGNGRIYCRSCKTHPRVPLERSVEEIAAVDAANKGYAPENDLNHPLPAGQKLRGMSTMYKADGTIGAQWIKTRADDEEQAMIFRAACAAMAADLPQVAPRAANDHEYRDDLMSVYPIGDPHIGMYAWQDETGDAWDLKIAERVHCGAMAELVERSPRARKGVVLNLGDALHYDSLAAVTPRSGHNVDADGRYAKMASVAVKTLRQCVDSALEVHDEVEVIHVPGNHDETGALWLAIVFAHIYENEPRVKVHTSPALFHYVRFGKVLIGAHHGHSCKAEKLMGVMAVDRAKDWGETLHRHWLTGHIHHESKKEYAGCTVESFNTLAGKDAHATNGGWRSNQSMTCIVYHHERGEWARTKVFADAFGDDIKEAA
ncbi:oxidoreductase [Dyella caseinilytica]|uniref:Oxidoreductase n=1 Tax=Dyella caseinilytica TaxID=1849581 RepID=A0ABX7GPR1_9GAMM|nr:oxidoreductase [Dyella caseinilytica]QRN52405.1 oxidoreductase [Dyella caseinilytica]GGA05705.1 hypothetical protein GCM10011408_28290 [Dyella caseinilytica]